MSYYQWEFLLVVLAGWINRHQQDVIEYLLEEKRIQKELRGRKRLYFTDEQRRRLAAKAKALGRGTLKTLDCIVTPDTLLAHHSRPGSDFLSVRAGLSARSRREARAVAAAQSKSECFRRALRTLDPFRMPEPDDLLQRKGPDTGRLRTVLLLTELQDRERLKAYAKGHPDRHETHLARRACGHNLKGP